MAKIVLDPITRIEGHLRMEAEITGGNVSSAWSTGTLFRGIEPILKNRNPTDAWMLTQRVCGVCTHVHGIASVLSVENSIPGLTDNVPDNAKIVRNLLMGAQYIQDHIIHFYHLHLLDWINVPLAVNDEGAAAAAAALDGNLRPVGKRRDTAYFQGKQNALKAFALSGQLGPFKNGFWTTESGNPHPAYSPATAGLSLMLMSDYLEALKLQSTLAKMHAMLGGKNPHPQSLLIGGVTLNMSSLVVNYPNSILNQFLSICNQALDFVQYYYLPDVKAIAQAYDTYTTIGTSYNNFLVFGEFPEVDPAGAPLFPSGVIINGLYDNLDITKITEHVNRSWYKSSAPLAPEIGKTEPLYSGININDKYSWLKAPRYDGNPMEVGPLARLLVGRELDPTGTIATALNAYMGEMGLSLSTMNSTIGRLAARAIETLLVAQKMPVWTNTLITRLRTINVDHVTPFTLPDSGTGCGLSEAPRGALGHWVNYVKTSSQPSKYEIQNYQMIVPSTWNFGPRDANNMAGPVEKALQGTPVSYQPRPVEILRVIHSFDPCIACAVHAVDARENK